jgi:hypothetical protein
VDAWSNHFVDYLTKLSLPPADALRSNETRFREALTQFFFSPSGSRGGFDELLSAQLKLQGKLNQHPNLNQHPALRYKALQPGSPDEFVKKPPKMKPNPFLSQFIINFSRRKSS